MTSSSVPWMMRTGEVILEIFSMLPEEAGGEETRGGGQDRDQGTPAPPAPQNTSPGGEGPGNAL